MKKLWLSYLFVLAMAIPGFAACGGSSPNWTPAAATEAAIRDCVESASNPSLLDGDAVFIDFAATITVSTQFNVTKAITVKGRSCTLDTVNGKSSIPTSCPTIITVPFPSAFQFTHVASKITRIENLEFTGSSGGAISFVGFSGTASDDGWRYAIKYVRFVDLGSFNIVPYYGAWGVTSHAYITTTNAGAFFIYPFGIDYDYSDERWAEATTDWGTDRWNILEDSVALCPTCSSRSPLSDGYAGSKVVIRFNYLSNRSVENHGTESGRARGGKAIDSYKNTLVTTTSDGVMHFLRSGTSMIWGISASGFTGSTVGNLLAYRTLNGANAFGVADGTNPWDINDGGNPQFSLTAAGNSTHTPAELKYEVTSSENVTVAAGALVGYSLKKMGCTPKSWWQPCAMVVSANTAATNQPVTITYSYINAGQRLPLVTSDAFTLNKISHLMDGPCRSGGSNLSQRYLVGGLGEGVSLNAAHTEATVTMLGHGLTTSDYIFLTDGAQTGFLGMWKVSSVVDADHFKYTLGTPDIWDSTYSYNANEVVIRTGTAYYSLQGGNLNKDPSSEPAWWAASTGGIAIITVKPSAFNNQTTEGCYQWLNDNGGADVTYSPEFLNSFVGNAVDAHYFDYDDDKMIDGTLGPTKSSVGIGTRANRPSTCQKGFAWWSTDQGGNWDTLGGGANDGTLDICTATDTWTNGVYTPYTYPSPLAGAATPGARGRALGRFR